MKMVTGSRASIPGIVKNGVIVPQGNQILAEGTHVEIVVGPAAIPEELRVEMEAWDGASDEAWSMIEKWEADE